MCPSPHHVPHVCKGGTFPAKAETRSLVPVQDCAILSSRPGSGSRVQVCRQPSQEHCQLWLGPPPRGLAPGVHTQPHTVTPTLVRASASSSLTPPGCPPVQFSSVLTLPLPCVSKTQGKAQGPQQDCPGADARHQRVPRPPALLSGVATNLTALQV